MTTALDKIIAYKRDEVAALKRERTFSDLDAEARGRPPCRGFAAALDAVAETGENALICEIKRKSPSAGEILLGADPAEIARDYERGGAACLSVLTDEPSFGGSLDDLQAVRAAVDLPLLRKDFMIDPIQVAEARANGADAILVIMAAMEDSPAGDLIAAARDFGLDALVEVHDREELDRALALEAPLVGVNNRNLKTMTTDLAVTEALAPALSAGPALISESGVRTAEDIRRLRRAGARRFLIGESLMREADRVAATRRLRTAS